MAKATPMPPGFTLILNRQRTRFAAESRSGRACRSANSEAAMIQMHPSKAIAATRFCFYSARIISSFNNNPRKAITAMMVRPTGNLPVTDFETAKSWLHARPAPGRKSFGLTLDYDSVSMLTGSQYPSSAGISSDPEMVGVLVRHLTNGLVYPKSVFLGSSCEADLR